MENRISKTFSKAHIGAAVSYVSKYCAITSGIFNLYKTAIRRFPALYGGFYLRP
jgi:hypothetical protein